MSTGADIRAAEILKRIEGLPDPRGVEVGVYTGCLSRLLLEARPDMFLYMVDNYLAQEEQPEPYRSSGDFHSTKSAEVQESFKNTALRHTLFAETRREMLVMNSVDAAGVIEDGSLAIAFLDADHTWEGLTADIKAWLPKVQSGGWLGGHDYDEPNKRPGVKRAVSEAVEEHGWTLELGGHYTWFVRL